MCWIFDEVTASPKSAHSELKMHEEKTYTNHRWLAGGLVISLLLNVLVICSLAYGGRYLLEENEDLKINVSKLSDKLVQLELKLSSKTHASDEIERREVISQGGLDLSKLLRGPPGPPGSDGRDGRDGHDGRDFTSLKMLHDVINTTVLKEFSQFSEKLHHYGGAIYTRWGRTSCPSTAKMIYKGFMAGPDHRAAGGGANYQCLPSDPEYDPQAPNDVPYAAFTSVWYHGSVGNMFSGKALSWLAAPCAVCETNQRLTKIMIPGKTRCPTSEWVLDYGGYIMTAADQSSPDDPIEDRWFKGTYECVDKKAEGLPYKSVGGGDTYVGAPIYAVKADCDKFVNNCPPYQSGKAISCVVCSK